MAVLFTAPFVTALNLSGLPIAGATLTFYATGTSTLATAYADNALSTPLANPLAADASGRFAAIYLNPVLTYRAVLKDASGAVIRDTDPVTLGGITSYTAPGTGAVSRSIASKLGDTISVKDFGAVADAVYTPGSTTGTDNAPMIQAAITYACNQYRGFPNTIPVTIRLEPGDYKIASGLTANRTIRFIGDNQNACRLICTTSGAAFFALTMSADNTSGYTMRGMENAHFTIIGDGGSTKCSGLYWYASGTPWAITNSSAHHISFYNTATGFQINGVANRPVYMCSLYDMKVTGQNNSGAVADAVTAFGFKFEGTLYCTQYNLEGTSIGPAGYAFWDRGQTNVMFNLTADGCVDIDSPNSSLINLTIEVISTAIPVSNTAVKINRIGAATNIGFIGVDPAKCPYGVAYFGTLPVHFDQIWFIGIKPSYPFNTTSTAGGQLTNMAADTAPAFKIEAYLSAAVMQSWTFDGCLQYTDRQNGTRVVANGGKPTAIAALKGQLVLETGAAASDDALYICRLSAASTYVWKLIV